MPLVSGSRFIFARVEPGEGQAADARIKAAEAPADHIRTNAICTGSLGQDLAPARPCSSARSHAPWRRFSHRGGHLGTHDAPAEAALTGRRR